MEDLTNVNEKVDEELHRLGHIIPNSTALQILIINAQYTNNYQYLALYIAWTIGPRV